MSNLASDLGHLFTEEENKQLKEEIRSFCNKEKELPEFKDSRVDVWWGQVKSYPFVSKLVKAEFTCFHGALVESSFSTMKRVLNNYTNCIDMGKCH